MLKQIHDVGYNKNLVGLKRYGCIWCRKLFILRKIWIIQTLYTNNESAPDLLNFAEHLVHRYGVCLSKLFKLMKLYANERKLKFF